MQLCLNIDYKLLTTILFLFTSLCLFSPTTVVVTKFLVFQLPRRKVRNKHQPAATNYLKGFQIVTFASFHLLETLTIKLKIFQDDFNSTKNKPRCALYDIKTDIPSGKVGLQDTEMYLHFQLKPQELNAA